MSNQATDTYISCNSSELVPVLVISYHGYTDYFNSQHPRYLNIARVPMPGTQESVQNTEDALWTSAIMQEVIPATPMNNKESTHSTLQLQVCNEWPAGFKQQGTNVYA